MSSCRSAFTLIELLVVVTIIVILIALLAPAMDQTIYQAELAACAAQQRGVAAGVTTYAMANVRNYPRRLTVDGWGPNNLNDNGAPNGRVDESLVPLVEPYFSIKMFIDPLCGQIDLSPAANNQDPATLLWSNYWLYFGWGFLGQSKMARLGQTFSSIEADVVHQFDVLVADRDSRWDSGGWTNAGHPDSDGVLALAAYQNTTPPWLALPAYDDSTLSWWHAFTLERGTLELNMALTDGSVQRHDAVKRDDPRMAEVPEFRNNAQYAEGRIVQLPASP